MKRKNAQSKPDKITVEVICNRLKAIAELMGEILVKSSFSANIKERRDCSTAIFDGKGRLVAQAEHIPLHLGSMMGIVAEAVKRFSPHIHKGDTFISNDPYSGGTHLPDVTIITPYFKNGSLLNFVANIAHHSDIGGAQAGGISGDARTIYEEGLRIPVVKLVKEGEVDTGLMDLIVTNCRMPEERKTDLKAQIATNDMGIRHLDQVYEKYGVTSVRTSTEEMLSYTQRRLQKKISQIPEGTYCFQDKLDDDGITDKPIPIKVCIKAAGNSLEFDFTGTGPQSKGALNVVRSALLATIFYAVKAFIDPDLPANAGMERAISIKAPEKSILNPQPPAAVGARTDTCQRIAGTIIGAFNQAIPQKAVAGSNDASTAVVFSRDNEFVYVEAVGGGAGASSIADGMDGVQVHITNTSNLPIEVLENEFPLQINRYQFIPDSGGRGKYRGGLGLVREIEVLGEGILFSSHADRHKLPPWGWNGGKNGKPGNFRLNCKKSLPSKNSGIPLKKNDRIEISTPGGGGFGDPAQRPREHKQKDRLEGKLRW
ncbi:MAG: hydantoinase B/oxoprolinase family protein [Actinomycetota bacterium]